MYRINLSPIPHYLSISYLFSHSSSIFSQPGCQAATSCATLYQSHQYLELSAMTCVELQKTNFASSVLILVGWWYDYLFFPIWFDMVSNVLNVMKSLRNLSESNEFETNARADVKYQYETFKYSSSLQLPPNLFKYMYTYVRCLILRQIARDVSSSSSILIEPSFLLVQFNHTPSVISAVWKSLRLSPCCLERKRENKIDREKKDK